MQMHVCALNKAKLQPQDLTTPVCIHILLYRYPTAHVYDPHYHITTSNLNVCLYITYTVLTDNDYLNALRPLNLDQHLIRLDLYHWRKLLWFGLHHHPRIYEKITDIIAANGSKRAHFSLCVLNKTTEGKIKCLFELTDKRIRDKLHRLWSPQRAMSEREAGHTAMGVTDAHCLPPHQLLHWDAGRGICSRYYDEIARPLS